MQFSAWLRVFCQYYLALFRILLADLLSLSHYVHVVSSYLVVAPPLPSPVCLRLAFGQLISHASMFLSRFLRFFSVLCYSQCWFFFCLLIIFSCKLNWKLYFIINTLSNLAIFFLPEERFTSYTFTFFTAVTQWFPSTIGQYKGNNDQLKEEPIENDKYLTHFQYKWHVLNLSGQQQQGAAGCGFWFPLFFQVSLYAKTDVIWLPDDNRGDGKGDDFSVCLLSVLPETLAELHSVKYKCKSVTDRRDPAQRL